MGLLLMTHAALSIILHFVLFYKTLFKEIYRWKENITSALSAQREW